MKLFSFGKSRGRRRRSARGKAKRRDHVLNVRATVEVERRMRWQSRVLFLGQAVILLGLLVFIWVAIHALAKAYIFDNGSYRVARIEVDAAGVMTRENVLQVAGIEEGMNIFSLNLYEAQKALEGIPEVRSAQVERYLPDKVAITLTSRRPVAWVAPRESTEDPAVMENARLVDAEGVMMKRSGFATETLTLPVVFGVPVEQWRPGDRIDLPELHAALDLFRLAGERAMADFPMRAADISKGWCITVWGDPESRATFGLDDFPAQFERLALVLGYVAQTKRRIATINLMPERNVPVTFRDEPAVASALPVETVRSAAAAPAKSKSPARKSSEPRRKKN